MPESSVTIDLTAEVDRVADRLVSEYDGRVPPARIRGLVRDAYRPMQDARVKQFVPVLVARSVRERLHEVAG